MLIFTTLLEKKMYIYIQVDCCEQVVDLSCYKDRLIAAVKQSNIMALACKKIQPR